MSTSTFDIQTHLFKLLEKEPFFAAISRRINKKASTSVPTAGVRVNPESAQLEMIYNPDFFNRLVNDHAEYVAGMKAAERRSYAESHRGDDGQLDPYVWVRGIIKHELFHIVFGHICERLPDEGMTYKWNIATDLAINSNISDELPKTACVPGYGPFAEMPIGKNAEWYFNNLPESDDDSGEQGGNGGGTGDTGDGEAPAGGSGDGEGDGEGSESNEGDGGDSQNQPTKGTTDDHSGWGDASDEIQEMARERAKQIVKEAVQESAAKGWGSVSGACKQQIIDSIKTRVNWRSVLRYFVKQSQRSNRTSTVRCLNRRQPFVWAGKRVQRQASIAVSIDQSGSVSNAMLQAFFSELEKLAAIAEFTVIPFDTVVNEDLVYTWKKGEKKKWERVMCGGTCFNAPTQYVNDNKFDGHIVLTDMEAPKPIPSKVQRMWMTDERSAQRPYFQTNERVIAIDV